MKKMQWTGGGSSNKGRTLDKPQDHQGPFWATGNREGHGTGQAREQKRER